MYSVIQRPGTKRHWIPASADMALSGVFAGSMKIFTHSIWGRANFLFNRRIKPGPAYLVRNLGLQVVMNKTKDHDAETILHQHGLISSTKIENVHILCAY
jgi:hypothetical protein